MSSWYQVSPSRTKPVTAPPSAAEQDAEDHPVEAGAAAEQTEVAHGVQQRRVLGGRIRPVTAGFGPDDPDPGGGCDNGF